VREFSWTGEVDGDFELVFHFGCVDGSRDLECWNYIFILGCIGSIYCQKNGLMSTVEFE
jgi:hypothetical protein